MPKSYDDPVKQLSREKLRDFIVKYGFPHRKPEDTRVVCFPGAEPDGVAIEVTEVYDKLGIPRQNIVGLELYPEKAERLRQADIGIEVVCQDAKRFFAETDKSFDVISLDYTGPQTLDASLTLEAIASRQVLSERGLLATVYLAKRESKSLQRLMAGRYMHMFVDAVERQAAIDREREPIAEGHLADLSALPHETAVDTLQDRMTLGQIRESTTYETVNIFVGGTVGWPVGRSFYHDVPARAKIVKIAREIFSDYVKQGKIPETCGKKTYELDECEAEKAFAIFMTNKVIKEFMSTPHSPLPRAAIKMMLAVLANKSQKAYIPKAIERYGYVSNSGSPMIADFFAFKPVSHTLHSSVSDIFSFEPEPVRVTLGSRGITENRLLRKVKKITGLFYENNRMVIPQRVFLGSSYKRKEACEAQPCSEETQTREDAQEIETVLTEQDARDFLKLGCGIEDIIEAYPGCFTRGQLEGYSKADEKGNDYDGKKAGDRKVAPEHMEEVMRLIAEGKSSTEIAARFAGRYTWQAVAALKGLQTKARRFEAIDTLAE
ncbi:hypothetical protein JW898_01120 [Candidatus Woesearchaeota archaeon]|nr:hypothetical protein [Candidatus Woesearchaeota archaeon]